MSTTVYDKLYALNAVLTLLDEDNNNCADPDAEILTEHAKGGLMKSALALVEGISSQILKEVPEDYYNGSCYRRNPEGLRTH